MSSTSHNMAPLSTRRTASAQERRPFTDPIEIPAVSRAREEREASRREEEEEGGCAGVQVLPHELLERRRTPFSMCSGQGRTLKGRDLRRVRESVLRMTGFIEG